MMVVVLEDAAEDIESGKRFYESCERELVITLPSRFSPTLTRSFFTPAFIPSILDSIGCSQSDSHSDSTMRLKVTWRTFMPSWI
jgi:hypothetical protein